jgi:hypothetical protein
MNMTPLADPDEEAPPPCHRPSFAAMAPVQVLRGSADVRRETERCASCCSAMDYISSRGAIGRDLAGRGADRTTAT